MSEKEIPSTTFLKCMENKLDPEKDLIYDTDGYVRVTADGACSKNGDINAIAGIGICFAPDSKMNISERIVNKHYATSNNLAELMAIHVALRVLKANNIKKVKLLSDSNYAVKALNYSISTWQTNNWKNAKNKPVHHEMLFKKILELKMEFESVEFIHVYARKHEYTNIIADNLAKKAVYTVEQKQQYGNEDLIVRRVYGIVGRARGARSKGREWGEERGSTVCNGL
ncbi:ribonuclease H-like [Planococcus citri]|uniref:ribonuclease H-like n=1 Tax=Planococcus citri TaxID=170843 RepID=UPI0031F8F043